MLVALRLRYPIDDPPTPRAGRSRPALWRQAAAGVPLDSAFRRTTGWRAKSRTCTGETSGCAVAGGWTCGHAAPRCWAGGLLRARPAWARDDLAPALARRHRAVSARARRCWRNGADPEAQPRPRSSVLWGMALARGRDRLLRRAYDLHTIAWARGRLAASALPPGSLPGQCLAVTRRRAGTGRRHRGLVDGAAMSWLLRSASGYNHHEVIGFAAIAGLGAAVLPGLARAGRDAFLEGSARFRDFSTRSCGRRAATPLPGFHNGLSISADRQPLLRALFAGPRGQPALLRIGPAQPHP